MRFQVYLAGPVMNMLLAVIVLAVVLSPADLPSFPMEPPLVGTVTADSPAARAGLQPGDLSPIHQRPSDADVGIRGTWRSCPRPSARSRSSSIAPASR